MYKKELNQDMPTENIYTGIDFQCIQYGIDIK